MSRGLKIFIVISIVLGIVLAILLGILALRGNRQVPAEQTNMPDVELAPGEDLNGMRAAQEPPVPTAEPTPVADPEPVPAMPPEDLYLEQLAKNFVEQLGSYSNQNDNAHIEAVLPFATERMQEYVRTELAVSQNGSYRGVTTRVISTEVISREDASAEVYVSSIVTNQSSDGQENRFEYDNVRLEKIGDEWKVSGVFDTQAR